MKKSIFFVSLLFLILSLGVIFAEENQTAEINQNFQSSTNNFLSQEIVVPQNLQVLARAIFGIQSGENIELSVFIVLAVLLLGIFFIIKSAVNQIEIFEPGIISWTIPILITLFISATGAIRDASIFIFKVGSVFKGQDLVNVILITLIVTAIIFLATKLISSLSKSTINESKKEEKRTLGLKVGARV